MSLYFVAKKLFLYFVLSTLITANLSLGKKPSKKVVSKDPSDSPPEDGAAPVRRKRGGQPGNQNARHHGFFSQYSPVPISEAAELSELDQARLAEVEEEIRQLRGRIQALFAYVHTAAELESARYVRRYIKLSYHRLLRMCVEEHLLSRRHPELKAEIEIACSDENEGKTWFPI